MMIADEDKIIKKKDVCRSMFIFKYPSDRKAAGVRLFQGS